LHFADDSDKVNIVIETDDFTASERRHAYEMVHTMLGRFDMLIPANSSRWQYHRRMLGMLWNYDRPQLFTYINQLLSRMMKGLKWKKLS
jgi:hypothetical protein